MAENETSSSNIEPKGDVKKLFRIRGGHKGAFTKSESKIDLMLSQSIVNEEQLCEAEALLANLKNRWNLVHRYDAEIELLIDDEDELSSEIDSSALFDERASIALARLESLINTYKQKALSRRTSTSDVTSGTTTSKMKLPKLQLPSFTGSYTEWTSFIDLFRASVDSNMQLTKSEKLNYLRACLKGDAAKLISSLMITDANYEIALTLLRDRYENKRCIVQAHLKVIWSQPSMKCESGLGMRKILETTNEHLRALKELGEPTHAWNSLLIFWITEKLDNESEKQWQLAHPGTDLLQWQDLVKFLDSRSRALELGNVKECSQAQTSNINNSKQDRRIQSYSTVSVCNESCSEPHKIHACPNFKSLSVSDRTKLVRSKQLCFNCLQSGHGVGACTSKYTCREYKMKHHTLLHRDKSLQANSSIKGTIQSNAASTETIKKNHETVVKSHCNTTTECRLHSSPSHSLPFNNVLLSTAYVSLRDKAGNKISMRALLDSGSQASFITEAKAKALMLPIEKTQIPIAALGAAKTQKTLGLIAMKLNDVVETNLHVIQKLRTTYLQNKLMFHNCGMSTICS